MGMSVGQLPDRGIVYDDTDQLEDIRVRFGPRPTQTMPLDWAERMLTTWRDKNRKAFGEALAAAATWDGDEP